MYYLMVYLLNMEIKMKIVLSILLLTLSFSSLANYNCKGLVKTFGSDKSALYLNNGYGIHKICTLENNESCKLWASTALSAQAQGKELSIYFNNSETNQCSTLGSWQDFSNVVYFVSIDE